MLIPVGLPNASPHKLDKFYKQQAWINPQGSLTILFKGANENFDRFFQQQIEEDYKELNDNQ